jgi:hypothetical protein
MTPPQPLFANPFRIGFSLKNDTVTLPSNLLAVDTSYTFTLRVLRPAPGRFKGAVPSSTVSTTVVRRDRSLLKVTAIAPVAARRALSLSLDAVVVVCAQSDTLPDTSLARRLLASPLAGVVYQWSQLDGPPVLPTTTSFEKFRLSLPAYALSTFATYTFAVVVTSIDPTIPTASANVTFDVLPSSPVALITGAQYRSLAYDAALTLDASASLDPDYLERGSSKLALFWPFPTLTAATPVTAACQAQHDAFIFTWVTLDVTSSSLVLPVQANLLCAGLEYQFSVVVSHADLPVKFANTPTAAAFTIVVADAAPPPPLADTVVHFISVEIQPLDADRFVLGAFTPGEKLRLQATVTRTVVTYSGVLQQLASGILTTAIVETSRVDDTHIGIDIEGGYQLVYRWSETHAFFNARDAANLAGAPDVSSLILGTDALPPSLAGIVTTLRLDVTLVSPSGVTEAAAFSKLDVTLNAPPTVEFSSIDATSGTAGVTRFAVECVGAADPDEPLSFLFAYAFANSPSDLFPLADRTSVPRADVLLPVGSVFVVCYAFDSFGAQSLVSTATPLVTVAPLLYLIEYNANATCSPSSTLVNLLAPAVLQQQSVAASLQQINSYFTSITSEECATLDCAVYELFVASIASITATAKNTTGFNDATAQQLSSSLTRVTANSTIAACPAAFSIVATIIADLIAAVSAANRGTNSSVPIGDQGGLSKGGASAVIASLSGSLSSLVSSVDDTATGCDQFDSLTALVDATLGASSTGSVAGEATNGIVTDSIKASSTRVSGEASTAVASSSSSSSVQFDFPVESVSGLACADIQIVEYVAPQAVACRANAASTSAATNNDGLSTVLSTQLDTFGTGLDRPTSTIVEADIVDCDGNVIDVANLTEPISFLIPLVDDALLAPSTITTACPVSYLPNEGVIASKNIVVEKDVECSFFDESKQRWSSDGCVVTDNNVTQADGSRAVRCECTHLTEFAILLREKGRDDATSCNISPASVFGSIIFLVFACLFSLLLALAARQTYLTIWAYGLYEQKTMLTQHTLVCLICIFRIVVCVIYYELQHASVQANVEFKAVAAISGLPYIFMLWLFSLLVTNWASIYYAAKRNDLAGVSTSFKKFRPYFIVANATGTILFASLFLTIALSTDAKVRSKVTLAGSSIYAIIVFTMSIAFAFFGYGLLEQLSKDFKSSSAERICKVSMIFCACFVGEACIWLLSGSAPDTFFANFEVVNSVFFSLDLVALVCILLVTKKTLTMGVENKRQEQYKPKRMTAKRAHRTSSLKSQDNAKGSKGLPKSSGASTGSAATGTLTSRDDANASTLRSSSIAANRRKQARRNTIALVSRKLASQLSQKLLPTNGTRRVARSTAPLDLDDPRFVGVSAAAADTADGTTVNVVRLASPATDDVDVHAFTSENEFGDTVIDVSGVVRQRRASSAAADREQQIEKFSHWFERLSGSSGSVSSLESFGFSELSSLDNSSTDSLDLERQSGSDSDAWLDMHSASDNISASNSSSSTDDTDDGKLQAFLEALQSLSGASSSLSS